MEHFTCEESSECSDEERFMLCGSMESSIDQQDIKTNSTISVHVEASSDVQIGPRLNYNAPVSINKTNHHQAVVLPTSIQVEGCSEVHIGPKLNYNGPVTINQFVQVSDSYDALQVGNLSTTSTEQHAKDEGDDYSSSEKVIIPNKKPFTGTDNIPSGKLQIIPRLYWLAQPPMEPPKKLQHPVPYVVILHTATERPSTRATCVHLVRHIQCFHIEGNGWPDIGYSFLVGGDGYVYEGRGWDAVGAFASGYNNLAIGIGFIGTFITELPVPKQIYAGQQLIAKGVELGKISPNYKLLAHRQLSSTESPGEAFYELIKTWPHWTERPDVEHTMYRI